MVPGPIKQSLSRHKISVDVAHFGLSERPASNSALFQEAARIILDGRPSSKCWMQRAQARNATAGEDAIYKMESLTLRVETIRVAFQGEAGAFSEAAASSYMAKTSSPSPAPHLTQHFAPSRWPRRCAAGSGREFTRGFRGARLRFTSRERTHHNRGNNSAIEMNLIGCPGAALSEIRSVSSHPMALAQCERFFGQHPALNACPRKTRRKRARDVSAWRQNARCDRR